MSGDVASYFSHPDGDALTYGVAAIPAGVVTASIAGSTVTIAPEAAGNATVTVTASDVGGSSATQAIVVTVQSGGRPAKPVRWGCSWVRAITSIWAPTGSRSPRTASDVSASSVPEVR